MSRLIDADALIAELNGIRYPGAPYVDAGIRIAVGKVCDAPTIEERKTGKWIEVDDAYNRIRGRCSVCGWEAHMYEDDVVGMNYCPNCAADMRGGQNG